MSLADYVPVREAVTMPRGADPLLVRGLALEDIAVLFRAHMVDIEAVFNIFTRKNADPDQAINQVVMHAVGLMKEAPGLVANMIALAADMPENVDNARRLPMAVQIKAVEAIAKLTFEEAGGPKKFVEGLAVLLKGLAPIPT